MLVNVGYTVQLLENDYIIINIVLVSWQMKMVNYCIDIDDGSGLSILESQALYREIKAINHQSPPFPPVNSL